MNKKLNKSELIVRNRQNNYTNYEIELFKQIIADENKLKIIENKSTDKYSKQEKDKVWEQIRDEFIKDMNTNNRDIKSLKNFWKRYKFECRKSGNKEKSEIRQTGGGPQPKKCDPLDDYISSFVEIVTPLVNEFDDDFVPQIDNGETQQFNKTQLNSDNSDF